MKNIIIAGWSRTGKTTLAKRINEEFNCFVMSLDKLVATFDGAYPQLDIKLNWNYRKTTDNIAPFLGHFLGMCCCKDGKMNELMLPAHHVEGNRLVMEGAYFDFDTISSVLKTYDIQSLKDHFVLIGLVQNNKTEDEFVNDFKKYDTKDDWTHGFSHDDLKAISQEAIVFNKEMTDKLTQHGFTLYDTSKERDKVFDKIIDDIRYDCL